VTETEADMKGKKDAAAETEGGKEVETETETETDEGTEVVSFFDSTPVNAVVSTALTNAESLGEVEALGDSDNDWTVDNDKDGDSKNETDVEIIGVIKVLLVEVSLEVSLKDVLEDGDAVSVAMSEDGNGEFKSLQDTVSVVLCDDASDDDGVFD
jgi:hypothetical protein